MTDSARSSTRRPCRARTASARAGSTSPGRVVGGGGFEVYGEAALLRSVVVDPAFRGQGFGVELVAALLDEPPRDVREVWLLTTTAAPFFASLGFETVALEAAPRAIGESDQFAGTCPDSATAIRRRLPPS